MVETGVITPAQRARALAQPSAALKDPPTAPAQYFVDWLDGQARRLVGSPKKDLIVETTLDMPSEAGAARALGAALTRYAKQGASQGAVVMVDGGGAVRAMVGGADYRTSPYNRAVDARRQAGSAWKPFVYLAALEAGRTPDVMVMDEPITLGSWSPKNYGGGYLGPLTLEQALAQSVNTVAVRLADEVGRPAVVSAARRVGITSPVNSDPAMALGTTLVSPLEMAQAYAAFSNGGGRVTAYGLERIRAADGQVLYQRRAALPAPAIANPPLSDLDRMLRTVIASGTGKGAAIPGYDIAGKTGTTSDYKDAWFCGFSGNLAAVVWIGRDDAAPMQGITGGSAPAQAWRSAMTVALKRRPPQAIPYGPAIAPPVAPAPAQPEPQLPPAPDAAPATTIPVPTEAAQ
jgi:penicillin-binding protein 1A